jgi:hypothetical protein
MKDKPEIFRKNFRWQKKSRAGNTVLWILFPFLLGFFVEAFPLNAEKRLQIEVYGGVSAFNPKDLNLFSRAEEQYNELFFIQRLLYMEGYFTNDLPDMKYAKPLGLRLRWSLNSKLSLSLAIEGFSESRTVSLDGTFNYVYPSGATERHTRAYDPYRLALRGNSFLAGIHYRFPVGEKTELELGAHVGWMRASFDYSSTWTYAVDYWDPEDQFSSLDGGTLEGDGSGSGAIGRISARISRLLTGNIGFFVETAASLCRINSFDGVGRETRLGIPGEEAWQGTWGIKKEDIKLAWASDEVEVPSNYWEGWSADLRERDFNLNLSGVRLVIGLFLRL